MTLRTTTRVAAALGAATALTVAGAGTAMAATTSHSVNNQTNTISVTFAKEGTLDVDLCFAAVAPTADAAELIEQFQAAANLNIDAIWDIVSGNTAATALRTENFLDSPVTSVLLGDSTVSAEVEPNVYTLVSKCTGEALYIRPGVIVGNPIEAAQGSMDSLSTGDSLGALSTVMQGGDGGGSMPGSGGGTGSGE
ncbi:hypothetical protein HMPREF3086_12670 [Dietzia sp. HMSC21D01]|uniref:Uncharacterized protein n=1 Tax=Dietzia cinnamea TaxID=321318 RepID=A0AAW5Q583_9ACTN|nr:MULTISPECIES: hypothetical protein [Dietzia]MCT1863896.1 hypothetical protein [Dietzia cinnamea]MCT2029707.1 hypothetical protein [Dietzia cinnamea]MCT2033017.1 hypothetical protein [Dietzia cinnamea]MCT2076174.1 hypothetical protein [Dietzia cinnamea]MCT2097003.1 hypothetical protein [Dietzia cinnamea]